MTIRYLRDKGGLLLPHQADLREHWRQEDTKAMAGYASPYDQNVKGFTFQHFVESWESYLPHLPSRSTRQSPTSDQVVTNDTSVVTNGPQVVTNELQVVTNRPQVGTNSRPGADIPNVFNTSAEESSI